MNGPSSNIIITQYHHRTWPTAVFQTLLRPFGTLVSQPGKPLPAGSPRLTPPSSVTESCDIAERQVEGIWIYDLTVKGRGTHPKQSSNEPGTIRRVYYIAGGSFCMLPLPHHWALLAELSRKMPRSVISLISPPLAPHCPAPVTFPHLLRLYKTLMANGSDESVSFAGDSSGGTLVFSLVLLALKDDPTINAPKNLLMMAPLADSRLSNPDIEKIEAKDPMLRRHIEVKPIKSWADSWNLADPRLSPLLADMRILGEKGVKIHGVTGGYDLVTPDTLLFRKKCEEAGIAGEWLEWDKQMHCFPLLFVYHLPESIKAKDWIVDVLNRTT